MRYLASVLAIAAAVAALDPAAARAQMNFTFVPIGGRTGGVSDLNTYLVNQPINGTECSGATLSLDVTGIPPEPAGMTYTLSLWKTTSTTENCQGAMARRLAANPMATNPCVEVEFSDDVDATSQRVDIPLSRLFSSCDSTIGTTTFCLLAMANSMNTTEAALGGACFRASLDVTAPAAAELASTAQGETTANVSITAGDTSDIYGYRLCTGGACDGDGGTPTIDPASCGAVVSASSPTSISVSVTDLVIGGPSKSVAIILVDRAGNESPMSNGSCVSRVNVDGFWDTYCRDRGLSVEACRAQYSGCSCRAGAAGASVPALVALVGVLAAILVRRRA